jgi:putative Mg2+ transporter-C (MgtC) family protein
MHYYEWIRSVEMRFLSDTVVRLILAAFLGGAIGMEREYRRKPAGLRTNMFICFGSAMFTIMSYKLASEYPGDHTRIAAQIIPGIGFIGAGSILHSRGSVIGLTTAATLFVVASIGMAVGGGLYLPAIFATILILLSLILLGFFEERLSLKPMVMAYEALGPDAEKIISGVNDVIDAEQKTMQSMSIGHSGGEYRVLFKVEATRNEHLALMQRLRQSPAFARVAFLGESEKE